MKEITVTAVEVDLSEAGRLLMEAVRRQSRHLAALTMPDDAGVIEVMLDGHPDSDDMILVWLKDSLSFGERARTFGGLGPCETDRSGRMAAGAPIPTEEYIQRVESMWGKRYGASRPWYVRSEILRRVRRREVSGAEALNEAGEDLVRFCKEGRFEIA